jgi:hypothetical protein
MNISVSLDAKSINHAIKQVEKFKDNLQVKLERFVSELANVGIEVIQDNIKVEYDGEVRNFGDSVTFQKEISGEAGTVTCILTAEGQPYLKEWIGGSALVNPLLMAEFGSGARAVGGAQGTFPTQTHAMNPPWFWRDSQGKTHMSYGSEPSRPLFKAKNEMENQIRDVAQRVFST